MLISKPPCHGCTTRTLGCHDHCISFGQFKAQKSAVEAKIRRDLEVREYESGRKIRIADRMQRGARL